MMVLIGTEIPISNILNLKLLNKQEVLHRLFKYKTILTKNCIKTNIFKFLFL